MNALSTGGWCCINCILCDKLVGDIKTFEKEGDEISPVCDDCAETHIILDGYEEVESGI
jgi:hypothetical protein